MNIADIFAKSPLPRLETEVLVSFLLKKDREFLLTHPETSVSRLIYKKFLTLAARHLKYWPIAYLIGQKEFYGRDFKVNPTVLIPRPETELMVEEILSTAKNKAGMIVDVGTGSGAIIITVAAELKKSTSHLDKDTSFAAVDISPTALKIAKENARQHSLSKIGFYRGDLLAPLKLDEKKSRGRLIIAANLPYLTPAQIKGSPSIKREPRLALDGGPDGLKYYRRLFQQLVKLDLRETEIIILCEINPGQRNAGIRLVKKYFPDATARIKKDLAKKYRLLDIGMAKK
jgi:release factor glutamine methyltransferase